jgi:hypothetical protein
MRRRARANAGPSTAQVAKTATRSAQDDSFLGSAACPRSQNRDLGHPQIVEGLKKQESETRLLLEKARAALESLGKEG